MANKLISQIGLLKSMANLFAARNILTANEFELMELLEVGFPEVTSAVARISEMRCPHYQTAFDLMEGQIQNECLGAHLPTCLKGLDKALSGGIPFGAVTELVGPAGIGKTQLAENKVISPQTSG